MTLFSCENINKKTKSIYNQLIPTTLQYRVLFAFSCFHAVTNIDIFLFVKKQNH